MPLCRGLASLFIGLLAKERVATKTKEKKINM
jgi:hypothetical protein